MVPWAGANLVCLPCTLLLLARGRKLFLFLFFSSPKTGYRAPRCNVTSDVGRPGTVGASSSVTRRVLAEIVYAIYYEVWAVFVMEYTLKG